MAFIITLIVIGLILLMAELTIIPGFGIAGILGLASFIGAIILAFTQFGSVVGFCVLFGALVVCGVLIFFILRSKTWRKISLKQSIEEKATASPQDKGITVGMEGISITRLNPAGNGRFGDVTIEVRAEQGLIDPKTPIRVTEIDGLRIFVTPVEN